MQRLARKNDSPLGLIQIFKYWIPEAASAACLIFLPIVVDLVLVAKLKSTPTYSAIGVSSNLIHMLIKLSEGLCIAGIATIGRFNGAGDFSNCKRSFFDLLTATMILGALQALIVTLGAKSFMHWIEAPEVVKNIAVPFIKVQAMAIFMAFVFMAFLAFFKAIKDTRTPFFLNITGMLVFLIFDYALILGKFGFPAMGYMGSAVASNIRYLSMLLLSISIILWRKKYARYFADLDNVEIKISNVLALIRLSLPIMIDKTMLSFAYIWLAKMVAPLGVCAIACMDAVKNVERLAFIPAMAFAQIITFIVSNNLGEGNVAKAKANIHRILLLALVFAGSCLLVISYKASWLISFLDPTNSFSWQACKILKVIAPLVLLDLVQLILSAALRGAGDVTTVMLTRLSICMLVFFPLSFLVRKYLSFAFETKIIFIYASFYLSTAIMAIILWHRIQQSTWQKAPEQKIKAAEIKG